MTLEGAVQLAGRRVPGPVPPEPHDMGRKAPGDPGLMRRTARGRFAVTRSGGLCMVALPHRNTVPSTPRRSLAARSPARPPAKGRWRSRTTPNANTRRSPTGGRARRDPFRPLGPCGRPDLPERAALRSRRGAVDGVSGPGTVTDDPFGTELPTFFNGVTARTLRLPTVVLVYRTARRAMGRARQPRTRGMPRGPSMQSGPPGCRGQKSRHRFTPSGVDSHAT